MLRRIGYLLLVAGLLTPPALADLETIRRQALELDTFIDRVMQGSESVMDEVDDLEDLADDRYNEVRELARAGELSDDLVELRDMMLSGEEEQQLQALDGAYDMGDHGLILILHALKESEHASVRQMAIDATLDAGEDGVPVLLKMYPDLESEERLYVVQRLAQDPITNYMLLVSMTDDRRSGVRETLIDAGPQVGGEDGLRLTMMTVLKTRDDYSSPLLNAAARFDSELGLTLLYLMARSDRPNYQVPAVRAAAGLSDSGLVVVNAALASKDADVRKEVVLAAKAIDTDDSRLLLDRALDDPDEELRQVAEALLEDASDR